MKKKLIIIASIILTIIILTLLYCRFIGTSGLEVKEYLVTDKEIPDSFYGLKIVQISDIHYGRIIKEKELNKIVNRINLIKPDIVILTGDLLDKDINYQDKDMEVIKKELNRINTNLGKYIITGNHDLECNSFTNLVSSLNFTNLDDSYQVLYNDSDDAILIAGLSTMANNININKKLEGFNTLVNEDIKYKILITHEPDIITTFDYSKFNLILAGHSHGGQVRLPLIGAIILPPNAKKYHEEYYDLDKSKLYISSGLGTSSINFRLNNTPSFNLYRLVNK